MHLFFTILFFSLLLSSSLSLLHLSLFYFIPRFLQLNLSFKLIILLIIFIYIFICVSIFILIFILISVFIFTQFERLGFFVVDKDSVLPPTPYAPESHSFVFNLTVTLKDSKPKAVGAPSKSRKDEQAKALADKMVKMLFHRGRLSVDLKGRR